MHAETEPSNSKSFQASSGSAFGDMKDRVPSQLREEFLLFGIFDREVNYVVA